MIAAADGYFVRRAAIGSCDPSPKYLPFCVRRRFLAKILLCYALITALDAAG